MIKTTYTCDRCGADCKLDRFWTLSIIYAHGVNLYKPTATTKGEAGWCRACMVKAGLLPNCEDVPPEQVPETPPTIEDLIRQIVRGEVEAGE